jgi:hypothetical protein
MDFSNSGIFIDKAGFHINMKPSRAWAPKEKMTIVTTPITKAHSHSIIGATLSIEVVKRNICILKEPPKKKKEYLM